MSGECLLGEGGSYCEGSPCCEGGVLTVKKESLL